MNTRLTFRTIDGLSIRCAESEPRDRDALLLSVFFNATQADTATSATDRQIALGGEYHGPFGRPYDFIGIAVGATHANGRQARFERLYNETHADDRRVVHDGNEYVGEVFYSFAPVRSMQFRANLQYIHNPGGTDLHDAFVAGLKTVFSF